MHYYFIIASSSSVLSWHIQSRLCLDRQHPKPIETTYTETSLFFNQSSMMWAVIVVCPLLLLVSTGVREVVWLASEATVRLLFVSLYLFHYVICNLFTIYLDGPYHETVWIQLHDVLVNDWIGSIALPCLVLRGSMLL